MQGAGWALYGISLSAFLAALWLAAEALSGHHMNLFWLHLEMHTGRLFSTSRALPLAIWVAGTAGVGSQASDMQHCSVRLRSQPSPLTSGASGLLTAGILP